MYKNIPTLQKINKQYQIKLRITQKMYKKYTINKKYKNIDKHPEYPKYTKIHQKITKNTQQLHNNTQKP